MKLFVINAGSSTLKFQLYEMPKGDVLASGNIERIGTNESFAVIKYSGKKDKIQTLILDHKEGVDFVLKALIERNIISSAKQIKAIGHRTVSAGSTYHTPTLVTDEVIENLKDSIDFAPLHIPGTLKGVEACKELNVPNVLVFDTGFHFDMPKVASTYAIKKEDSEKFQIRRYGAHGLSHEYSAKQVEKLVGKKFKLINCHLGSGASICAIKDGKCQDTSMGLTPLEGLVMGTRCGDIDPSLVSFLCAKKGMNVDQITKYLTNECGIKGLFGSNDMRDVEDKYFEDENAKLAQDIFVYRVVKYIGSYSAVLNGVDVINFTAGIGEHSPLTRKLVCDSLGYLGVELDQEKNNKAFGGAIEEISTKNSKVKVFVIPADEEIVIAKATYDLVK